MHYSTLTIIILLVSTVCLAQTLTLPLWEKAESLENTATAKVPDIAVYLPSPKIATGQAVIICPGGGYRFLAYDWEGTDIAKWLNSKGIAGLVLRYTLPQPGGDLTAPLKDAQRAIRLARQHAAEWNLVPDKIGIMGFSAGGHLAATAGTHFDNASSPAADSLAALSARPDFMILLYPVISLKEPYLHRGSRQALLGDNPDPKLTAAFSNELHVTAATPPTFLVHAGDDTSVPVENSLLFYQALKNHGVPAELHIYPEGGHGFSLALGKGRLGTWTDDCMAWLRWMGQQKSRGETPVPLSGVRGWLRQ